jgi:hypothetical protein
MSPVEERTTRAWKAHSLIGQVDDRAERAQSSNHRMSCPARRLPVGCGDQRAQSGAWVGDEFVTHRHERAAEQVLAGLVALTRGVDTFCWIRVAPVTGDRYACRGERAAPGAGLIAQRPSTVGDEGTSLAAVINPRRPLE